jgi:general secretion pathway protein I
MSARRASGFTLLEILIALAIAALGLGALMAATGTGLGNADLAARTIEATRRAQSHLASVGIATPLRPGIQAGDDGENYRWRLRISEPVLRPRASTGLYTIEITIAWGNRDLSLTTQRLGPVGGGNG